jgi:hypothetical protein
MGSFRTETLPNGLILEFFDKSNRYFGDYWRVALEARCRVPVFLALPPGTPESDQARTLLGDAVVFTRPLEKMGVPSAEVEEVRSALVGNFLATVGIYMGTPDFPPRFVRQRLAEGKKGRRPFLVSR